MPEGIVDDDSDEEEETLSFQGEREALSKDEEETQDDAREDRMLEEAEDRVRRNFDENVKEVHDFIKCMKSMQIPALEDDLEGWEVKKDRRKVRKERIQQEVCVVEKGGENINSARVGSEAIKMCLRFQVADAKKPLISVKMIVEQGNKVGFGPEEDDNFIFNEETGSKLILKANGK